MRGRRVNRLMEVYLKLFFYIVLERAPYTLVTFHRETLSLSSPQFRARKIINICGQQHLLVRKAVTEKS